MSASIEDLLDSEDNGDFDIGDAEEEALLNDNFDITKTNKDRVNKSADSFGVEDQDDSDFVLDLDNTTDFNEEDNEENVRQDRFQSERPVQQVEVIKEIVTKPNRQEFKSPRNNVFRGRRPQRGNFRNNNQRNIQNYNQNKRVLINPHFKGQVPIRNNVSLVWDKNIPKKPAIHVQPWAHTARPQQNAWIRQPSFQGPYHHQHQPQINAGFPIQQKLGIPSNIIMPPINNHQFFHPPNVNIINPPAFQQASYAQPAQIVTPQYGANYNTFNQFPVPQYNVAQPVVNSYSSSTAMCLNPTVTSYSTNQPIRPMRQNYSESRYNVVPNNVNFQRTFTVKEEASNNSSYIKDENRSKNLCNMGPHARRRFLQNVEGRAPRSNLQEIKTSHNICNNQPINQEPATPNIAVKIEKDVLQEDESMIQYRQLIENQKKLREKVLQRKEERRKNAAISSESDEPSTESLAPPKELLKTLDFVTVNVKCQTNLVVPSLTVTKSVATNAQPIVERFVPKPVLDVNVDKIDKTAISSFLTNRKIIAKDDALPDTSVVVVSNLATGSTEVKLRKLCKGVGDVKTLVMSPLERQATIQFKSVASAHAFYKKYQRFMLDLSMIQVTLKES